MRVVVLLIVVALTLSLEGICQAQTTEYKVYLPFLGAQCTVEQCIGEPVREPGQ